MDSEAGGSGSPWVDGEPNGRSEVGEDDNEDDKDDGRDDRDEFVGVTVSDRSRVIAVN